MMTPTEMQKLLDKNLTDYLETSLPPGDAPVVVNGFGKALSRLIDKAMRRLEEVVGSKAAGYIAHHCFTICSQSLLIQAKELGEMTPEDWHRAKELADQAQADFIARSN